MSKLLPIEFDLGEAANEIEAFRQLLDQRKELSEASDILPFFRTRPNLSALIGQALTAGLNPDRLRHEMVLFGDFRCDLVVGNVRSQAYCFIEFEDARKGSVFRPRKSAWEYSPRFEKGFSQLVDWIYLVEDLRQTHRFEAEFGSDLASYDCLLVAGRDQDLTPTLRKRLRWRAEHTLIASKKFYFVTFDELFSAIANLIGWWNQFRNSSPSSPS